MYVELGDKFCPCVTIASFRHSPLVDHLRLTVTSLIAGTPRKLIFPPLLTLAIIHHVCPYVFHFTPLTSKIAAVYGFRFARDGMAEIISRTLTATPPRYSTIKELDRRIRELSFPPEALEVIRGGPGADPSSIPLPASMTVFLLSTMQDVSKSSSLSDTTILRAK